MTKKTAILPSELTVGEKVKLKLKDKEGKWFEHTGVVFLPETKGEWAGVCLLGHPKRGTWEISGEADFVDFCVNEAKGDNPIEIVKDEFNLDITPHTIWWCDNSDTKVVDRLGQYERTDEENELAMTDLKVGDIVKVKIGDAGAEDEWHEVEGIVVSEDNEENWAVLHVVKGMDAIEWAEDWKDDWAPNDYKPSIAAAKKLGLDMTLDTLWFCHPDQTQIIKRVGTYEHKKPKRASKKAEAVAVETKTAVKEDGDTTSVGAGLLIGSAIVSGIVSAMFDANKNSGVRVEVPTITETIEPELLKEATQ